jgi:hypothetical protein
VEQVATVAGIDGNGVPLTSLAVHIPRAPGAALHHCEDRQSASLPH